MSDELSSLSVIGLVRLMSKVEPGILGMDIYEFFLPRIVERSMAFEIVFLIRL